MTINRILDPNGGMRRRHRSHGTRRHGGLTWLAIAAAVALVVAKRSETGVSN